MWNMRTKQDLLSYPTKEVNLKDMLVKAKINVTWRQLIMRHSHKNHIGSRVQVCLWLPSKLEKPRKHIGHQNPKNRFICAKKPKTRMLIKRKTRNRNGQKNRNTEVFQCKNRKFHGPPLLSKHNMTQHDICKTQHKILLLCFWLCSRL